MQQEDGRHVRFDNNDHDNGENDNELPRPQTALGSRDRRSDEEDNAVESARRRSSSDPSGRGRQRPRLAVLRPRGNAAGGPALAQISEDSRSGSTAFFNAPGGRNAVRPELADILDVIDPEVSTLNNVTNIQNSLFIPSLGRLINRHPTYNLTRAPGRGDTVSTADVPRGDGDGFRQGPHVEDQDYDFNFNHAVLPEGVFLEGWTKEEMAELNDHVRHMLHSRRSKFKRTMKAFGKYVRRPVGFCVTLYATLITLFGLAWVLFLIGWIYVGSKQLYVINVIDYVLVALFAIMGDGLAPFRAVDTYHMLFISHYHRKTWKLRKKLQMAKLRDKNDLPTDPELEAARDEVSVLTEAEQATLVRHQNKFAKSHTFYRPHETKTHYAFPQNFLVAIVLLLDLHSALQISLGATTWGIYWKTRPPAITATILSVSIAVNITAGILISIGGRRTRKKEVVERMFRQDLTREALKEIRERGKKDGDTEKQIKAERAIEDTRKSETLDEAVKSHVPVRDSLEMGSRYDKLPMSPVSPVSSVSPASLKSPRPSTQSM